MGQQLPEQIEHGFILDEVKIIQHQDKGLLDPDQFVQQVGDKNLDGRQIGSAQQGLSIPAGPGEKSLDSCHKVSRKRP